MILIITVIIVIIIIIMIIMIIIIITVRWFQTSFRYIMTAPIARNFKISEVPLLFPRFSWPLEGGKTTK